MTADGFLPALSAVINAFFLVAGVYIYVSLARWSSLTVPTLVMDGGTSPGWQRHAVRALLDVLPDARHLTLEGQDHGPDSEVLAPVLVEFFRG